ncbi:MAG: L-threonylcarbamoyladenylate synthase [Nitrospirota bacterium]
MIEFSLKKRTNRVLIDPLFPERTCSAAREVIASGGVIVYPTDTYYALGADPRNRAAVEKIFALKGRPAHNPILLLIRDTSDVCSWAVNITRGAENLMKRFWPGPLTLVFDAQHTVLNELSAGTNSIGLRVPAEARVQKLLAGIGGALTATSANISGKQSVETVDELPESILNNADLILDGGKTIGGKPSTVVDTR